MPDASAVVVTYGELAVDVFYVRDIFGHKVIQPERLAAIEEHDHELVAADPGQQVAFAQAAADARADLSE